jgi:hypothetical protein
LSDTARSKGFAGAARQIAGKAECQAARARPFGRIKSGREHRPVTSVGYYRVIEKAHMPVWQKRAEKRHFLLILNPSGPKVRAERPCWKRSIRLKY